VVASMKRQSLDDDLGQICTKVVRGRIVKLTDEELN